MPIDHVVSDAGKREPIDDLTRQCGRWPTYRAFLLVRVVPSRLCGRAVGAAECGSTDAECTLPRPRRTSHPALTGSACSRGVNLIDQPGPLIVGQPERCGQ